MGEVQAFSKAAATPAFHQTLSIRFFFTLNLFGNAVIEQVYYQYVFLNNPLFVVFLAKKEPVNCKKQIKSSNTMIQA